jgi:hypothetical protein
VGGGDEEEGCGESGSYCVGAVEGRELLDRWTVCCC